MSEEGSLTSKSKEQRDEEPTHPAEPVVAQQPNNEPPQPEELPAEIEDDTLGQEGEDELLGAEGLELEEDLEEEERPKTGRERGDGPDVKGKRVPRLDYTKLQGSGEGPSQA